MVSKSKEFTLIAKRKMAKPPKQRGKSEKESRNMMIRREGMFIFKLEIRCGLKFIPRIVEQETL